MTPTVFPWGDVAALDDWCRAYALDATLANLNSLHLAASIFYAKLSTFAMEQNAKQLEEDV